MPDPVDFPDVSSPGAAGARPGTSAVDEFYVGYLRVPVGQRRFLRIVVPVVLWTLCGVAFVVARSQRDPGAAVWDSGLPRAFTGTLVVSPYPVLLTSDRGDGRAGELLLVEMGKHGSHDRALAFGGKSVRASGWLLKRDGRRILELEPGDAGLHEVVGEGALAVPAIKPLGSVELRGEIVDSKCFLGAMKPGDGKTHKECATLCVTGGIPPMLVTRDERGEATYYLLTNESGGALSKDAWPMIGEPVLVRGELESWGDLLRVRVLNGGVTRLAGGASGDAVRGRP